jgi:hypothetical protein
MERFAYEHRMKPADASAIAAFLTGGGRILKVPEGARQKAREPGAGCDGRQFSRAFSEWI